jgi:3D (Asp-Asp-Asp) domain-containing protein
MHKFVILFALTLALVHPDTALAEEHTLVVTASAYNSLESQTNSQPSITAWGNVLKPGMKSIAVSRDLIALGLGHNAVVRIEGFPGEYRVLDKMAKRWKKKIDIYMGNDARAAREWGVRKVTIHWVSDP